MLLILYAIGFPVVIWIIAPEPNYDAIPSSEQMIYNASKKPDEKRHHLAYVTNIDASEFQFFLWFYTLTLLILKERWPNQ